MASATSRDDAAEAFLELGDAPGVRELCQVLFDVGGDHA